MPEQLRAKLYLRTSPENENTNSFSLYSVFAGKVIVELGFQNNGVIFDYSLGRANADQELDKIIATFDGDDFDILMVRSFDYLCRDQRRLADIIQTIESHGIRVMAIDDIFEESSDYFVQKYSGEIADIGDELDAHELKKTESISAKTLADMDSAIANFNEGIISPSIDLH